MSIHSLYKRAVVIIILVGPAFWLLFTEEGQRFGDITILKIIGRSDVDLSIEKLSGTVNEASVRQSFPDVEFDCRDQPTAFGARACFAKIAAFNGTPSRYITFFFDQGALRAMKVGYQRAWHKYLVVYLRAAVGEPDSSSRSDRVVFQWDLGTGLLVLPERTVEMTEEPALLWLAAEPGN